MFCELCSNPAFPQVTNELPRREVSHLHSSVDTHRHSPPIVIPSYQSTIAHYIPDGPWSRMSRRVGEVNGSAVGFVMGREENAIKARPIDSKARCVIGGYTIR